MRRAAYLATLMIGLVATARAQAPGPESFAKPPQTPMELWDAVDYLVRVGQADEAAPYLEAFVRSKPADEVLLEIRDRYGASSILALQDHKATRAQAEPLLRMMADASVRNARNPQRLRRFVAALTRSADEQDYAVERLREAGPYAVPFIIDALNNPHMSVEERTRIVHNLGRLDRTAVPPLIAVLDAPDTTIAAEAAEALGQIGDLRAVPFLIYDASHPELTALREPARLAIQRLTGLPFNAQSLSPVMVLTLEARRYLTHAVSFPGVSLVLWGLEGNVPAPRTVSRTEAEGILGLQFAREALMLEPTNLHAQATLISLAIQKSIERVGLESFPTQDPMGAYPLALAAGPAVLGDVVRGAIDAGLSDVAAAAVFALGRVTDRDALAQDDRPNPLVEALSAPDRRVRFSAARALVELEPQAVFAGASRVVPTLAPFAAMQADARIIVIDGNELRANHVASVLRELGYETQTASSGDRGFQMAASSADIEAIFIEPTQLQGAWLLADTLRNLRADANTAGLPIFLYGPLKLRDRLTTPLVSYPRVTFTVTPVNAQIFRPSLERELKRFGNRPLSAAEREGFARRATELLAEITARPGTPLEVNITAAEPSLAVALNHPPSSVAASTALADVPNVDAQRSLADAFLNSGSAPDLRLQAARSLARSVQRFGPLLSRDQEERLVSSYDQETDATLRASYANVVGALRPKPLSTGLRLRAYTPSGAVPPPPAPAAEDKPPAAPTPSPDPAPATEGAPAVPAPNAGEKP
jgi:HEAT repeat protein